MVAGFSPAPPSLRAVLTPRPRRSIRTICRSTTLPFFTIRRPSDDPALALTRNLGQRKAKLDYRDGGLGYLPSLLKNLRSTSIRRRWFFRRPAFRRGKSPRAIRARSISVTTSRWDGCAAATVLKSPRSIRSRGMFYTLGAHKSGPPRLTRREVCLKCHRGPATGACPECSSARFPRFGRRAVARGAIITDHRTKFEDRWGGWYVNAKRGEQRDRANAVASDPAEPESLDGEQNLTGLIRKFDPAGYLTPVSDIVALMTFEHQTQMVNMLTRAGWQGAAWRESRRNRRAGHLHAVRGGDAAHRAHPRRVHFHPTFPQRGPRDRKGRSLRDFDFKTRLFRYPLSYMIYSAQFDALPDSGARACVPASLRDFDRGGSKREILAPHSRGPPGDSRNPARD